MWLHVILANFARSGDMKEGNDWFWSRKSAYFILSHSFPLLGWHSALSSIWISDSLSFPSKIRMVTGAFDRISEVDLLLMRALEKGLNIKFIGKGVARDLDIICCRIAISLSKVPAWTNQIPDESNFYSSMHWSEWWKYISSCRNFQLKTMRKQRKEIEGKNWNFEFSPNLEDLIFFFKLSSIVGMR